MIRFLLCTLLGVHHFVEVKYPASRDEVYSDLGTFVGHISVLPFSVWRCKRCNRRLKGAQP